MDQKASFLTLQRSFLTFEGEGSASDQFMRRSRSSYALKGAVAFGSFIVSHRAARCIARLLNRTDPRRIKAGFFKILGVKTAGFPCGNSLTAFDRIQSMRDNGSIGKQLILGGSKMKNAIINIGIFIGTFVLGILLCMGILELKIFLSQWY